MINANIAYLHIYHIHHLPNGSAKSSKLAMIKSEKYIANTEAIKAAFSLSTSWLDNLCENGVRRSMIIAVFTHLKKNHFKKQTSF